MSNTAAGSLTHRHEHYTESLKPGTCWLCGDGAKHLATTPPPLWVYGEIVAENGDHYFHPLESVSYISNLHQQDTKTDTDKMNLTATWWHFRCSIPVCSDKVSNGMSITHGLGCGFMQPNYVADMGVTSDIYAHHTSCCSGKHCATVLQHARLKKQ